MCHVFMTAVLKELSSIYFTLKIQYGKNRTLFLQHSLSKITNIPCFSFVSKSSFSAK